MRDSEQGVSCRLTTANLPLLLFTTQCFEICETEFSFATVAKSPFNRQSNHSSAVLVLSEYLLLYILSVLIQFHLATSGITFTIRNTQPPNVHIKLNLHILSS